MSHSLTIDEYDALLEVSKPSKRDRPSACVARNTKRLTGLKYFAYGKDGQLGITEKGLQTLFLKRCIDGLRAVSIDPQVKLDADVATFLGKKGHVVANPETGELNITQRGSESLADIEANGGQQGK